MERWPPRYSQVLEDRNRRLEALLSSEGVLRGSVLYYAENPCDFIEDWCFTHDPRNAAQGKLVRMPFIPFRRQREMVQFLHQCVQTRTSGLIEKSRDMGATWIAVAFSCWMWRFYPGASIGWGSRKAQLVDTLGDMDSIFEKIRATIRDWPLVLHPRGFSPSDHMTYMRIVNPENGATITGESGDNIGRGGRKSIYFKDESAHYEHPESIEAALMDNTEVQVDISSVNGLGNVFHRRRESGVDWAPGVQAERGKVLVFVMDWRDHPLKTMEWYEERRQRSVDEGMEHLFAQEVDRNYSAAVEGTIIPAEWVSSAIDAHKKIKCMEDGPWTAALDVADEGGDRNALAARKGVVLRFAEEWGDRDPGVTTRRAVDHCRSWAPVRLFYDCIGVGVTVKSEANRLADEKLIPKGVRLMKWDAGAAPLFPEKRVVPGDRDSPLNKDFYQNLKAQGWWELRMRFERTHQAVTKGVRHSPDDLISLTGSLARIRQLQKELSQPTRKPPSGRMRLVVDKMPEGSRSPNLGDAVMMCYWPAVDSTYDSSLAWVA